MLDRSVFILANPILAGIVKERGKRGYGLISDLITEKLSNYQKRANLLQKNKRISLLSLCCQ